MSDKEIEWVGSSLDDLRDFPEAAKQDCGFQLHLVQNGMDLHDWKPMPDIGPGTREIRVKTSDGAYRVFYVATLGTRVYVLHSFVKKTQKTTKQDIATGKRRYKDAQKMAISEEES